MTVLRLKLNSFIWWRTSHFKDMGVRNKVVSDVSRLRTPELFGIRYQESNDNFIPIVPLITFINIPFCYYRRKQYSHQMLIVIYGNTVIKVILWSVIS